MKRGSFNSKLGFILAASGSAVGLGNIWKFPFEVSNGGGGAFLLMYLFFCFILFRFKQLYFWMLGVFLLIYILIYYYQNV